MIQRARSLKASADDIQLPKGGVFALCAVALALPAALATGHGAYLDSQSRWIHHHTTEYTTCNDINENTALRDEATKARQNWMSLSQTSNGSFYGLDEVSLPGQTDCHPGGGGQSHIQLIDGSYGNTGWRASSLHDSNAWTNASYHPEHTHIHFNLSLSWSSFTGFDKRAMVCREIGRVLGVDRVPSNQWAAHASQNDCMSFDGNPANQVSFEDNQTSYTYDARPREHSRDFLDGEYADHGPDITLTGPLVEATDASEILHEPSYPLSIQATGGAQQPATLDELTIEIDGNPVWSHDCGSTAACSATWSLDPYEIALPVGGHRIEILAKDGAGFVKAQELVAYLPDRSGIGELDTAMYSEHELAGGGTGKINVASGNVLLRETDVGAEEGIVTGSITRYFNSLDPGSTGPLGTGWRLGIGESVKLTDGGEGSMVWHAPSGAKALFVPRGPCEYLASKGISSELTKVPATGGQPTTYEIHTPELDETWIFDQNGRLTDILAPTGPVRLSYAQGLLSALSFEDGSTDITFSRNAAGHVVEIERAGLSEPLASYTYSGGRLATYTNGNGSTTSYQYDGTGALTQASRTGGETTAVDTNQGVAEEYDPDTSAAGETTVSLDPPGTPQGTGSTAITESGGSTTVYAVNGGADVESSVAGSGAPTLDVSTTLPTEVDDPIDPAEPVLVNFEANDANGIEWAGIVVDGGLVYELEDPCGGGACPSIEESISVDASGLSPGDYAAEVVIADEQGAVTKNIASFRVPEEAGCGSADDEGDEWTPPATRTPTQAEVSDATAFRESVGLSTTGVDATFHDPDAVDAEIAYGAPLTNAEEAELDFRNDQLNNAVAGIEDYGADEPEFAGAYIDQQSGGVVRALFTGNVSQHEADLETEFEYPQRLDVEAVDQSLATLETTEEALNSDVDELRSDRVKLELAYTNVFTNSVDVAVAPPETSGPDSDLLPLNQAEALLRARYGSFLQVWAGEHQDDRRFRAGRGIRRWDDPAGDPRCASGYAVRYLDTNTFGMLTAAHCATDVGQPWYYTPTLPDDLIGPVHPPLSETLIDAVAISAPRRKVPAAIYVSGRSIRVSGVQDYSALGSMACLASRTGHDRVCGRLINRKANGGGDGSDRMRIFSTCKDPPAETGSCFEYEDASGGDSGGPWFRVRKRAPGPTTAGAVGVHEGRMDGRPWIHLVEHVNVVHSHLHARVLDAEHLRR